MKLRFKLLLLNLFAAIILSASTSSDAQNYYKNGQWDKAEQLYARLLKSAPTNRIYNHRYGVCLLEQSKDLSKAEKHLRIAQQRGIGLSNYYLGRLSFMTYKFDDAIEYYSRYISKSTDVERKNRAQTQLPQCKQAASMLSRTEDVEILDRIIVDRSSFFKHYDLSRETGSLIEAPQTIEEDSICKDCTIYMTERKDRTFFSVSNDSSDIDLYYKNKLLDQWSNKVSLGNTVNTPYDEAYPFLMSDGVVLYFSSKGHNALGGYDIFVTRFNAAQNAFLPPQQLGMPFNSPGDDMLFVIDEYRNIGWFASDRFCPEGKIYIYTFVPNPTIKLLDTKDPELLRNAAMLNQITADTSITSFNSTSQIEKSPEKTNHQQAFSFVINDTLIYSNLNDFMSTEAKAIYIDYLSSVETYDSIAENMKRKRLEYSKTTDASVKSKLITAIVKLEKHQLELGDKRDEQLQSVRRLEIETIRLNGGYKKPKPQARAPHKTSNTVVEESHISPWESSPATLKQDSVKEAFFYNKSLLPYYRQIYTPKAVEQLIEANRLRIKASDRILLADYVMKEFSKPAPEEGFFEKLFAYDSSFTEELNYNQMVKKVTKFRDEASCMMIESSTNNYYTLHGQNVLLMEGVSKPQVRKQMEGILDNATFAMQEARQQLYISDNTLTNNAEKRSRGNGLLRKSIKYQEAASLVYLQYRYEKAQKLKAEKPKPTTTVKEKTNVKEEKNVPTVESNNDENKTIAITNAQAKPKVEYRIQFGLFSRILKTEEIDLPEISYYQYSNKLLYKYYTGHYPTQMAAAIELEAVKSKGHKDAFVVKFIDGKPE